jgi:hypothetical protein
MIRGCTGCCLLLAAIALASIHPVWPILQCIGTLIAFAVTLRLPASFPFLFPLLLVSGDAYPFTGQLVLQEYDSLLMGSVAGMLFRVQFHRNRILQWLSSNRGLAIATCFLGVSVLISGAIGIACLPAAPWGDQLSVYFTQWNTLRIAKGYAWGILFAVSMWAVVTCNPDVRWSRAFIAGLHCAMVYVAGVVITERTLFESWFDFEREYRATGPFFTMHIGDQHIDGFAAIALPFAWASQSRSMFYRWGAGILLTVAMLLVAFMTMSRGAVVSIGIEILLIAFIAFPTKQGSCVFFKMLWRGIAIVGGIGLVVLISVAVFRASAFRERFGTIQEDWGRRFTHWSRVLQNEDRTTVWLFGRGMGTLPWILAKQSGRDVPPLSWSSFDEGTIQISPGWPIYLERYRWPASSSHQSIAFCIKVIQNKPDLTTISVKRCFKSMLHSYEEVSDLRKLESSLHGEMMIRLPPVESDNRRGFIGSLRPEALGIALQGKSSISITNARGINTQNRILGTSSAPWAFTCDDHNVWRAHNALVHILSEHGFVGMLACVGWLIANFWKKSVVAQDGAVSVKLYRLKFIALSGFCVVAMFGTLIDTGWIISIFIGIITFGDNASESGRP